MSAEQPTALQRVLATEHAAVHVLAALGAQTSRATDPVLLARVEAAYAAHRARRDQLVAMIRDAGGEPVAAEPAYQLPRDLGTTADTATVVSRRARELEADCAASYAWLVARTREHRAWAVTALSDAAVRELGFGGSAQPLPGIRSAPDLGAD